MDMLTGASALSSVVGLICNFKSERKSTEDSGYEDFLNWLKSKNYEDFICQLEKNSSLSESIEVTLSVSHDELMKKLKVIETSILAVSSQITGLREISISLANPLTILSEQAFSIIKQLSDSHGSTILEIKIMGGSSFQIIDGEEGNITPEESRFLEDDLRQLCDLGFLIPHFSSNGSRLFRHTRAADSLITASV